MSSKNLRTAILVGGSLFYVFILVVGLYGNYSAPRWSAQFAWVDGTWEVVKPEGQLLVKDRLLRVEEIEAHFQTLLVDNAFLSTRKDAWNWFEVKRSLYEALDSSTAQLVVARDEVEERIEIELDSHTWDFLRSEASSHLLVSLVFLLVGAAVLSPEPSKQVTVFYLLCLSMSLVYLTNALSLMSSPVMQPTAFKLLNLLNLSQFIMAPSLLFHFSLLMPRDRAPRWLVALIYIPSAIAILLVCVEAAGVLVPLFFLGSLLGIIHGALTCRTTLERQQMKWVGTGFLLGVGPWFLINGLPLLITGERLMSDTIPGAFLIAIPIFMAVAVKRYRLFDVGVFLEGTLVYVVALGILLALDLVLLSSFGLDREIGPSHLLLVGALLALWAPLRSKISSGLAKLIHREEVTDREALDRLSSRLGTQSFTASVEGLSQVVHELYAPTSLHVETADRDPGVYFEVEDEPTVLMVVAKELALRCGPLPKGRSYNSRALRQLELLTNHCALFYEAGLRLKEKETLLGDLHDGVGSALAKIRLSSEDASVSRLAQDALFELQSFLYGDGSYTFELKELAAEMRRYGGDFFEGTKFEFSLTSSVKSGLVFARSRALSLFRLYREALTNILKHSGGEVVSVKLEMYEGKLTLEVADDGDVEEVEMRGRGLKNMTNRTSDLGGTIEINSDNGFAVRVEIPL